MTQFPSLNGFGPTRRTLQLYARALSALARAHAPAHPRWWHLSLRVTPTGLITGNMPQSDGGIVTGRMDFHRAQLVLESSDGRDWVLPMDAGLSGSAMGERLLIAAAAAGLTEEVGRDRFASDETGVYDPGVVGRFFVALVRADRVFRRHSMRLGKGTGPVNFWPHGFDLSVEWYGSRVENSTEEGEVKELPAQLNLGFYPGEDDDSSYYYSSPWPFDADKLLGRDLPAPAVWHTDGWKGALLPYAAVRDEEQLLDYAAAVHKIASPLLNA
ncbi:MAG: hypothetical protein KA586_11735 [Candidatus Promineofilum sp.]|nr:hypothetical protein [Promineifilum sp.]